MAAFGVFFSLMEEAAVDLADALSAFIAFDFGAMAPRSLRWRRTIVRDQPSAREGETVVTVHHIIYIYRRHAFRIHKVV